MITVADDLDRSIAASKKNHDAESLAKGVEMVHKKLMSMFAKKASRKSSLLESSLIRASTRQWLSKSQRTPKTTQ